LAAGSFDALLGALAAALSADISTFTVTVKVASAASASASAPSSSGAAIGGAVGGVLALGLAASTFAYLRRSKAKGITKLTGSSAEGGRAAAGGAVINPLASAVAARDGQALTIAAIDAAQPAPPPLPELADGWTRCGPDEQGDFWYVNEKGETTWELPAKVEEVANAHTTVHAGETPSDLPDLPGLAQSEWEQHGPDEQGDFWYKNKNTGETTWIKPE
jgi:hypothetical protein